MKPRSCTYLPPEEGAQLTDVPDDDVHAVSELCDGLKQCNVTVSTAHAGNGDRVRQTTLAPADWAKPHGCSNHLLLGLGGEGRHYSDCCISAVRQISKYVWGLHNRVPDR